MNLNLQHSKLVLWLWPLPFLVSLLSAVSFVTGLPSLALVVVFHWRFRTDWDADAPVNGAGTGNQVAPEESPAPDGTTSSANVQEGEAAAPAPVSLDMRSVASFK